MKRWIQDWLGITAMADKIVDNELKYRNHLYVYHGLEEAKPPEVADNGLYVPDESAVDEIVKGYEPRRTDIER